MINFFIDCVFFWDEVKIVDGGRCPANGETSIRHSINQRPKYPLKSKFTRYMEELRLPAELTTEYSLLSTDPLVYLKDPYRKGISLVRIILGSPLQKKTSGVIRYNVKAVFTNKKFSNQKKWSRCPWLRQTDHDAWVVLLRLQDNCL